MSDLHSHILPHMDDGSRSTEMSYSMLRSMAEMGVDMVCATSYYYADQNDISTFCSRRLQAVFSARVPET